MDAAKSDSHILPSESAGDGLAKTCLSHPRRTVQTQDRGLHVSLQLEHCQIFYYPVLHCIQSVVVFVQHFLGILHVQVVLRHLSPREVQHELYIIILYAVFRRARVVPFQLGHLFLENLLDGCRPYLFFGPFAESVEVFAVIHAELFLYCPQLVVEVILPLLLVDFALYLLVDVLLDFEQLDLCVKHCQKFHRPCLEVSVLQKLHLFEEVLHLDCRGYEIDQELEVVNGFQCHCSLLRGERGEFQDGGGLLFQRLHDHLDVVVVHFRHDVVKVVDPAEHVRVVFHYGFQLEPLEALKYRRQRAVRHLKCLDDLRHGAVSVEVLFFRVFHCDIKLRHCTYICIVLFRVLNESDRLFPADGYRIDRAGEKHCVSQCQDRKRIRQFSLVHFHHTVTLHHRDDAHFRSHRRQHLFDIFHTIYPSVIKLHSTAKLTVDSFLKSRTHYMSISMPIGEMS